MQTIPVNTIDPLTLYTTEELAAKLNISVSSLRRNRSQADQIPYRKFGRLVRYQHNDVVHWLGNDTLELMTIKAVADLCRLKEDWLNHNRISYDPIPYRKIGGLIRYHRSDVEEWLAKQKIKV